MSQHLDSRYGVNFDEILLCNLAYGTRVLAQPDSWEKLTRFDKPGELGDDAWLARAKDAYVLVSDQDEWPDFVVRLAESLRAFAGGDAPAGKPELLELLDRSEKLYRERCMPRPLGSNAGGHLMVKPDRLVDFMFDHTRAFLTRDLGEDRDGVELALVREFSKRPAMKLRYEQQFCTPRTTQLRAEKIAAMKPASILVLGDDDLVSLALVRMGFQVDVLELDPDLVAFLKEKGGDKVTVLEHNLRHGVPESMRDRYELVTTDPPYAAEGMRFFLDCAVSSLAKTRSSRLFLSTFPGLIENPEKLTRDWDELRLKLVQRWDHFSRYIYNNGYRVEHLAALRHLGSPLKPTAELLGFPYLYAHFFELALA